MPGTSSIEPSGRRRFAMVSERVLRSVSACALPRPSATASAKFANSTVNQRNTATSAAKTFSFVLAEPRFVKKRIVVRTLPTSTTNMTGFRIMWRGFSLTKLSTIARRMIEASSIEVVARTRSALVSPGGRVGVIVMVAEPPRCRAARRWVRAQERGRT